jgi:hypothetical protein
MTSSNTNPATAQAFAPAFVGIAAASGPIFYRHPAPFAAAIFPMASPAVRMGRVGAVFWQCMRAMRDADEAWGPLMGSHSLWRSKSPASLPLSATNVAKANGVP